MDALELAGRRLRARYGQSDLPFILLLALATSLVYSPLLFQGQTFSGDERIESIFQEAVFYSNALKEGTSFLWNPHSYGGFPTYVDQLFGFFFPPVYLLFLFLPALYAFHLEIALATFGGLVFAYFIGRSLSLTRVGSLVLALGYALAQIPTTFSLGLAYAHSFLVLPLLLFGLVVAKRANSHRAFMGGVLLVASAIITGFLAGYLVTVIYALVFAGIFALFLDTQGVELGFPTSRRASYALLCGGIIGAVLSSPQLLALYDYSPYTVRTAAFAQETAVNSGIGPLDFVRWVLPYQFQFPLDAGRGYFYMGLPALLGVLVSLLYIRRKLVLFFCGTYLLFLAFATNAPLFGWINIHVPPFSHIGGVSRWMLVGSFAAAFLAGYGFDRLVEMPKTPELLRLWRIFRTVSLVGLSALALVQIPLQFAGGSSQVRYWIFERILAAKGRTIESLLYPPEHYIDVLGQEFAYVYNTFSFSNANFTIFIVLTLLSLGSIGYLVRTQNIDRAKVLVLVFMLVGFVSVFKASLGNTIPASTYFSREPAVVEVIRARDPDLDAYRFAAFQGETLARRVPNTSRTPEMGALLMRELLYREVGTSYGLRSIAGFQPIRSIRQNQLIETVLAPTEETIIDVDAVRNGAPIDQYKNEAITKKVTPEEKAREIEKRVPLLSMMNVKYIVSLYPLSDSRLVNIPFEPIPNFPIPYYLYENRSVLPHMYLAQNSMIWRGDDDRGLLVEILEARDFSLKTFIECGDCAEPPGRSVGSVEVTKVINGLLIADVESSTGGWVVFSESNLPGWIATVDGERVPIRSANYLFQAIEVPKGEHTIEFSYIGSFALFLEKFGL